MTPSFSFKPLGVLWKVEWLEDQIEQAKSKGDFIGTVFFSKELERIHLPVIDSRMKSFRERNI